MADWFFRHRDRVALLASLGLLGAGWALARFQPALAQPLPAADELRVTLEALPTPAAPETFAPPQPAKPAAPPSPTREPAPDTERSPQPSGLPQAAVPAPAPPVAPAPAAPPTPSPPPVVAPTPPPAAIPLAQNGSVDEGYRAELRALIERAKRYPTSREARQLRPTGTVKVWLELDRVGVLLGAGVEAGSGSPLLDQEALRTVRLGRYPAFPPEAFGGQEHHRFTVSLEYRLEGV